MTPTNYDRTYSSAGAPNPKVLARLNNERAVWVALDLLVVTAYPIADDMNSIWFGIPDAKHSQSQEAPPLPSEGPLQNDATLTSGAPTPQQKQPHLQQKPKSQALTPATRDCHYTHPLAAQPMDGVKAGVCLFPACFNDMTQLSDQKVAALCTNYKVDGTHGRDSSHMVVLSRDFSQMKCDKMQLQQEVAQMKHDKMQLEHECGVWKHECGVWEQVAV
eukprot:gene22898-30074_t